MYIYELPFDINRELCRLLDIDDNWKELAGEHMKYSAFKIIEIEQAAKRHSNSPTQQLFTRWGQMNHNVKELCLLLYLMRHVPALRCLVRVVDDQEFHQLLAKLERKTGSKTKLSNDENGNIKVAVRSHTGSIPLPVMLMQMKDGQSVTPSNGRSSTTSQSSGSNDKNISNKAKAKNSEEEIAMTANSISLFSYDKLTLATNNWSKDNLLGSGGFGQVYKGDVICLQVAVKKLNHTGKLNRELIREMYLNQYRHDNILPLYGYSIGGPEACLIYKLMTGGSLQQRIHRIKGNYPPLTWPQRYRIAVGVAKGLVYLHNKDNEKPLIHGDIKPANILLDQCLMPKIGDFGLARIGRCGDDQMVSRPIGTPVYLPKEYLAQNVETCALDTYSYGVVVLEMVTAKPPGRKGAEGKGRVLICLAKDILECYNKGYDFALLEDPSLKDTPLSNPQLCREMIKIGIACTRDRRQERPTMLDVYKQLSALDFPDKDYT